MIAVDTSALYAILFDEPGNEACEDILLREPAAISAPTVLEALTVSWRRGRRPVRDRMEALIADLELEVVGFDTGMLRTAVDAYDRYGIGRGLPLAALTWGDCFSYALAKSFNVPLLFVGDDFSKTDIAPALAKGG